jgi:hypothetical protein
MENPFFLSRIGRRGDFVHSTARGQERCDAITERCLRPLRCGRSFGWKLYFQVNRTTLPMDDGYAER